jgi:hypothetical protein
MTSSNYYQDSGNGGMALAKLKGKLQNIHYGGNNFIDQESYFDYSNL